MHQAKKRFGQNFLTDKNLLMKIVDQSKIKDKNVLEIGPGLGALTQYLVPQAKKYLAFEIDYSLKDSLKKFENTHTKFIFEDFLSVDVETVLNEYFINEEVHLVGNLPYYITSPIIFKFLDIKNLKTATMMVQKEVGLRMMADANNKVYNGFSVILQYFTDVKLLMNVNKKMFKPVPKVDSVVMQLTKKDTPLDKTDQALFIKLVKLAFAHKRKTLLNNLATGLNLEKNNILDVLKELDFNENTRAELLSVNDFVRLTTHIKKIIN
ncbi:16S rRNA (adenine(1518)-N(6)/adenine(1519)-N(6))-dimethyltransferase RsmA [Acholeplasma granularum]|uniref:16S rRNA (adenine(1518)-N(6)/adenine(1519)-N(6))- dimethyltransferase RsmA n=1 Tax=Acholeplasma granularum TaxID=264635 RepID=UPI0004707FF5|nr:16S rRNA (adenine(1518)-N(6)/adenine(1519)-N(6))-dimethyltransferase RsmA [Acholeplasma granularum]